MEEEEIEEKQENDREAQSPPQVVIYPKRHTKDEIIGDVSQGTKNANVGKEDHGEASGSSRGGIVLKRSEDRTVAKLDAYGRILHHIISNIVIPNVGHKSSITNMHSFVMLAMHENRKMNFGYIAIEHMLATQFSLTKCLPYGCFLTKVFQYFKITFFGPNDHIEIGKIYNQNTFKRMGFSRNEDGGFIRCGQEKDSENSEEEEEDEGNEPENMDEDKTNKEEIRREMRSKRRQEKMEEGSLRWIWVNS
ncbi:hypothetical protein M9H77_23933 [Catharanthus roseus]|uniref:Uncharacterized protein n=1 Tax=Catharanthus roseus TaxID=4058 RepID=A0ACC0AWF7_CATRO|nr:hypothetical protein M9H77_23933 [Catharanthus roseus]